MDSGLEVEITDRDKKLVVTKEVFHDFPITIGRDPIATIRLERYPFITKFHSKLELWADGGVMLKDSGSTNGTTAGPSAKPIAPHEWVDLRDHGMTFGIGPLAFAVRVVEAPRRTAARERGGAMLSRIAKAPPTARDVGAPQLAAAAEARQVADDIRDAHEAYRTAWKTLYERLSSRLGALSPSVARTVVQSLQTEFPALLQEQEFRSLAARLEMPSPNEGSEAEPGTVALELFRELAEWYGVRPPRDSSALIEFAKKLQDAVDVLGLTFVRLRDGLRSFQDQFEVEAGKAPTSSALGAATSHRQAAGFLLDWTVPADRTRAITGLIADLATHEMALVNGVAKGGAALVARFAPQAVLDEFEAAKRDGRVPFWGGFHRKLWDFYGQRHADLAREEQALWRVLFGQEFAQAYHMVSANVVPQEAPEGEKWDPRGGRAAKPATASKIEKTPETHGFAPGPTGTVVVPMAATRARKTDGAGT